MWEVLRLAGRQVRRRVRARFLSLAIGVKRRKNVGCANIWQMTLRLGQGWLEFTCEKGIEWAYAHLVSSGGVVRE